MAYKIAFKTSVKRDLKKISRDQVDRIFRNIEENLTETPENFPALSGSFAGLRKLRVGDYRVIFSILDEMVFILRITHRKETYRQEI